MSDVRVIGAGLSGLATAWYLAEAGHSVQVFEASSRPGGLIQTHHLDEGLVETAARAFTSTERSLALFKAVGIQPVMPRPGSKRRYIFRGDQPRRWPLTPIETAGAAAHLVSAGALRRMRPRGRETVADWGHRVLGKSATMWILAPALQGIYASALDALSAAAVFGGRGRTRGTLIAPANGMSELFDRMHDRLIDRAVSFEFNRSIDRVDPDVPTVVATNAPTAARLVAPLAPALANHLSRVRMVSLVVSTNFYEPRVDDLRGFGVLFPRSSGIHALGVLFNAEIFAGRSALRSETWFYGDLDESARPANDELTRAIAGDRERLTRRRDAPIASHVTRHVNALPVYDGAILDVKEALDQLPPAVALAGNYLGRLGVSALLDVAAEAANRVRVRGLRRQTSSPDSEPADSFQPR